MRRWQSWAIVVVSGVAVVALLVLLPGLRPNSRAQAPPTTSATSSTFAAQIAGVRRVDDRTVMIEVSLPAGGPDCARDLRIEMLEDQLPDRPHTVYANVVFTSAGPCPDQVPGEVTMRVTQPLGERTLLFNSLYPAWAPAGDRYRACDEILGCHPPADHCDPVWVDKATYGLDVPVKHLRGVREVRACDGTWLVLDVNRAVGDCPPAEGASKCDVPSDTTRSFLTWAAAGWTNLTSTREGGCAPIHSVRPDFPTALCEKLAPVK